MPTASKVSATGRARLRAGHAAWPLARTLLAFAVLGLAGALRAAAPIQGAPSGLIEAGVPPFVVLGPEALGLTAAPVDLQRMPDGRLLAFGHGEFAIGDGARWEVYHQAPEQETYGTQNVAIDRDGTLYAGVPGGFGRIEIGPDSRWRIRKVASIPPGLAADSPPLAYEASVGDRWFWWWGSGTIVEWEPGKPARVAGYANAPERFFNLDGATCFSDYSDGDLYRLEGDHFALAKRGGHSFVYSTVTCAVPHGPTGHFVGTIAQGVLVSDAAGTRPLAPDGPLGPQHRVNDLCRLGDGYYAAALDNLGIVFFNADGRVIQLLDRTADNRLSRIRRLLRDDSGSLWALLNDGLVRVLFPAPVSNFESLVPTGLAYAIPYRFDGRLWLMSDGRAQRGIYDEAGRLHRFEIDSPPGYLSSLTQVDGTLVAGSNEGMYRREANGTWSAIPGTPRSAYLSPAGPGRWLLVAESVAGWLRHEGGRFSAEFQSYPGLGHVYGGITDGEGNTWMELGSGRVACISPTLPMPTVRILAKEQGLTDGWAQLFLLEGRVCVDIPPSTFTWDAAAGRFERRLPDGLPARLLAGAIGRPGYDASGRLWVTRPDGVSVVDPHSGRVDPVSEAMPRGLEPLYFIPQDDGVVWMQQRMRLVRFDPSIRQPPPGPVRTVVTRVLLPESGRVLFPKDGRLPDLGPNDGSLTVFFASPASPMGRPVTFQMRTSEGSSSWTSLGSEGSATIDHLHAGATLIRVRAVLGQRVGAETSIAFTVLAPWYRTRVAYAGYTIGGLGLVGFLIWLSAYLQKREKAHLERIVALRTNELHEMNRELGRRMNESLEAAAALRVSEDRYRRLSDNAPDVIFRVRVEPRPTFDYISPAIAAITGHEPSEFYAEPALIERIGGGAGPGSVLELARQGAVPREVRELVWTARDGRRVAIEERLVPVFEDGRLVAIEGIARDVTARKNALDEVRILSEAVAQSPVGVFITDREGTIVFANPSTQRLTGWPSGDFVGRSLGSLRSSFERPELLDEIWSTLTQGNRWQGQCPYRRRDGRVLQIRASFSPLRDQNGQVGNYLALGEDISEAVDEQERRRRVEEQLHQIQKLESLGTLAGGIAHDFNNLLTGILGFSELAQCALGDGRDNAEELREIRTAGLRAKDLVAQILAFSRRGTAKLAPVELSAVVREALKLVRASTPATIAIETTFAPGLVLADAGRIHQVVVNLCTNGIHAMRERSGGRLRVAVEAVDVGAALAAEIHGLEIGPHLRLSVTDTGHGMDEATLARIFDPFFTTKRQGEGTGLGLSIVRAIVEDHHAALRVRSAVGEGTQFEVYFPLTREESSAPGGAAKPESGQNRAVVVVDDEPSVGSFVAASLKLHGYRAVVFQDPRQALVEMLRAQPRHDALVVDLTMPHMTGIELIQRTRAAGLALPAVVITGYKRDLADEGLSLGQVTLLQKPFDGADLARALGALLRGADEAPEI